MEHHNTEARGVYQMGDVHGGCSGMKNVDSRESAGVASEGPIKGGKAVRARGARRSEMQRVSEIETRFEPLDGLRHRFRAFDGYAGKTEQPAKGLTDDGPLDLVGVAEYPLRFEEDRS